MNRPIILCLLLASCTYQDPCWRACAERCDEEHPHGMARDACLDTCAAAEGCTGEPR